ncbi:unnamed protein product [Medioppia subpectinata]|uniref:S-adenosylmethionine synthetase N-terminal domain-containing protein n=1 Tax=Medioppia subpectinata TaxID=1979941 RepID=A0A7R9KEH0_9ACAR|nr:unnamed protein product [Medioppia subpectinata]CAG2100834.1 unnamed protein product [Medioppia subpectinata]
MIGEGHPDKVCDRISDAILDAHLSQDPSAKVAVETVASIVASKAAVNYQNIVRRVLKDVGYDCCQKGMDYKTVNVMVCLKEQSSDISQAVISKTTLETGAGDQGIMFGYATDENKEEKQQYF